MSKYGTTRTEARVRLLREGDPRAIETWFLEHADPLYTFVYYRVGMDPHLATDVVQETFVKALETIGAYDPERGSMRGWLTGLARNGLRRAVALRDRHTGGVAIWDRIDTRVLERCRELDSAPLPDEIVERRETRDLVRAALSTIPPHYQSALRCHYFEHHSLDEIARAEGMSPGAVKSLLHRARLAFKTAFQTIAVAGHGPAPETIP